jgi:hypothetical protein
MGLISVQMPERDDPLARVAKAMTIAQSVFGIKSEIEQSKIRKAMAEQENQKWKLAKESEARKNANVMTKAELDQEYTKNVMPETPGAQWTYMDETAVDPDTKKPILNAEGQPIKERKVKWYIPKANLSGENVFLNNAQDEIKVNQLKALENGYMTPGMLANKDLVGDWSTLENPGYRKTTLVQNGKESPIWIMTPNDLKLKADHEKWQIDKELKSAQISKLKQEKNPIYRMGPDTIQGYFAARELGIAEPTITQAVQLNPEKISKDVNDISKSILEHKVSSVVTGLENINKLAGGIDNDKEIPGYGSARWIAASKAPNDMARKYLTPEESKLKSAIDSLTSDIRLMRSGQAVSQSEQAMIDRVLGTNLFSTSANLKTGMRNIRDITKNLINAILTGKDRPSVEAYLKKPNAINPESGILQNGAGQFQGTSKKPLPFPEAQSRSDRGRDAIREELGE